MSLPYAYLAHYSYDTDFACRQRATSYHIISSLPEKAIWDDILCEIYVRQSVEQGLVDIAAGRTIPAEEVKNYLKQRIAQRAGSLEQ